MNDARRMDQKAADTFRSRKIRVYGKPTSECQVARLAEAGQTVIVMFPSKHPDTEMRWALSGGRRVPNGSFSSAHASLAQPRIACPPVRARKQGATRRSAAHRPWIGAKRAP